MGHVRPSQGAELKPSTAVSTAISYDDGPAKLLAARHTAIAYPYHCVFGSATLEIDEGVFCPTLTKTSPFLLNVIRYHRGDRVLDAFAGSGAFGIDAALHGAASVVLIDSSPEAVISAKNNAVLNDVEGRLEVREGTVSQCINGDDRFDLVIANPPLLPGAPTGPIGRALFDHKFSATTSFINLLGRCLAPSGRCYLLTSSVSDRYRFDPEVICRKVSLRTNTVATLDVGYESYRVHEIRRAIPPT